MVSLSTLSLRCFIDEFFPSKAAAAAVTAAAAAVKFIAVLFTV